MVKQWWLTLFVIYNVQGINITSITIDQKAADYTEAVTYEINATYQVVLFYPSVEVSSFIFFMKDQLRQWGFFCDNRYFLIITKLSRIFLLLPK